MNREIIVKSPCISLGLLPSKLLWTGGKQTHVEPSSLCWVGGSEITVITSATIPLPKDNNQQKMLHQDTTSRVVVSNIFFFFWNFHPWGKNDPIFWRSIFFKTTKTFRFDMSGVHGGNQCSGVIKAGLFFAIGSMVDTSLGLKSARRCLCWFVCLVYKGGEQKLTGQLWIKIPPHFGRSLFMKPEKCHKWV